MNFAIPSYKRGHKISTPALLCELGYTENEIAVSVQTNEDYEEYREKLAGVATVVFREAWNVSGNRNTLLEYFKNNGPIVMLDDDIKAFCKLTRDGKKKVLLKIETKTELETILARCFSYALRNNAPIWAWYPIENAFFMKPSADNRNLLTGTIMGIIDPAEVQFDEMMRVKEDYDLSLRVMKQGRNAVRFNMYTVSAEHYTKGGCEETRRTDSESRCCQEILRRYPEFIKPSHRENEIRFIGEKK